MGIELYDLTVGSYIQTLEAMSNFMSKSRNYFEGEKIELQEIVDTSLHSDMRPFSFQILAVVVHSTETLTAFETGVFDPIPPEHQPNYIGLEELVSITCAHIEKYDRLKLNQLESVEIGTGPNKVMKANEYLLSHALPNFYFHATTAYDILRMKGAPIGKLDFLGRRRVTVQ